MKDPLPGDIVCLRLLPSTRIYDTEYYEITSHWITVEHNNVMLVIHGKRDENYSNDINLFVFVNGGFGWIYDNIIKIINE